MSRKALHEQNNHNTTLLTVRAQCHAIIQLQLTTIICEERESHVIKNYLLRVSVDRCNPDMEYTNYRMKLMLEATFRLPTLLVINMALILYLQ